MTAKLLRRLDRGGGVHIRGFPWQDDGWTKLSVSSLGSKVLCKRHNSDLSALDDVGEKLVDHLDAVAADFNGLAPTPWLWMVNGNDVERWLLKTLCGALASKSARRTDGSNLSSAVPERWVRILYGLEFFPATGGFYFAGRIGQRFDHAPGNVAFAPMSAAGSVMGIVADLSGYEFTLLMADLPARREGALDEHSVHRPIALRFFSRGVEKRIGMHWDGPSSHRAVRLEWTARSEPPKTEPPV